MGKIVSKLSLIAVSIAVVSAVIAAPASAHVTVKPAEVVTASYQTFTVSVPNERGVATTAVKIIIPDNIEGATPTQKAGWSIEVGKPTEGEGKDKKVTSLTWSGGEIADGTRDEFTFSAKTPAEDTAVQWKAYQTYADGMVVSWDKEAEAVAHGAGDGTSGPFSVTVVSAESKQDAAIREAQQAAQAAQGSTRLALYSSIAAVILGLIGIYLGTRKTK